MAQYMMPGYGMQAAAAAPAAAYGMAGVDPSQYAAYQQQQQQQMAQMTPEQQQQMQMQQYQQQMQQQQQQQQPQQQQYQQPQQQAAATSGSSPQALSVAGCTDATVGNIVRGTFTLISENHGRPVYKKNEQVISNGAALEVQLYFWDERDGPNFCGWWFGPKVGGDQVWA
eukprot:CAMPEP_0197630770 /NCGR_PEP_ID=MMETSP1338-20131121/8149_1 /TAXON_ID=43686 ORGANISM="Pelagodinium beii, Strain RCC1491" /NCGR_SAMPLE_ID=MMETSP1338 /ASSEMBLY_ACC=CAM_ASM_000754 /LENGTH=169 /DNA_ID=CAMNT_0043202069 /DNA_START=40 /DNA_END=545 /DNA_ORIENTATION=+